MINESFTGVVLGGDMNAYAVARAFFEEYGISTIVIGQNPIFPTANSSIVEAYYYQDLLNDDVLVEALTFVDEKYPDKKKILFGNTDYYARHITHNRDRINAISDNFIIPIVDEEMFDKLFNKSSFYALCEKNGLEYPKSVDFLLGTDSIEDFKSPYEYPIFIKPSNSVDYAACEFPEKQKGYKIEDEAQLKHILNAILESGYRDNFVIQEYIEGNDESMFVYTAYVDSNHKVKAVTGGKILMHDRTPELIGNYNAITNACDERLAEKLRNFLEHINFTGICHFDIQYDEKRQDYVVFEMNIRQGRSNLYTLASGVNLAKLIVEDYIEHKEQEFFIARRKFTVSVVPKFMLKFALKKSKSTPYNIINFWRFGLAPYDRNLKRIYNQIRWDLFTMSKFIKYNK